MTNFGRLRRRTGTTRIFSDSFQAALWRSMDRGGRREIVSPGKTEGLFAALVLAFADSALRRVESTGFGGLGDAGIRHSLSRSI